MMGKQSGQIQMVILDIDSMIPEDHLLRRIKNCVNFDFIYEKAAPYYSHVGRKSIDPVVLIKMLLIGYLYGIRSERRLEEEVSLNLAYRWFCGFELDDAIPDHVKTDSQLYVLRNTKAPAVLIECCFVDDMDDAKLYDADKMANAIINGVVKVLGGKQTATKPSAKPTASASKPAQTTTHKVGGTVSYNKIFKTATSTSGLKPRKTSGVITKVLKGKANPYLIDGGTGWINDSCITGGATTAPAVNYYPAYTAGGNSITMALKSMGIDSSMAHRKQIAASNNIGGYTGTYTQNVTMLTLLKQGRLVAA